ncbi:penicillin-binding protein 2 [bacterium]|nr:MAG: penicillin-binding protein 2 [bacterium]
MGKSKEFGKYRISRNDNEIAPEEVIFGMSSDENDGEIEQTLGRRRIFLLGAFICSIIVFLFLRTFYLQIVQGSSYQQDALSNRIKRIPIEAPRGIIFSQDGQQLVWNISTFDLVIDTKNFHDEKKLMDLVKTLGEDSGETLNEIIGSDKLLNGTSDIVTFKDIPKELAMAIKANQEQLNGVEIVDGVTRFYPYGEIFAHVAGYVGRVSEKDMIANPDYLPMESIGKFGTETWYNKHLRGISGAKLIEVDSLGTKKKLLAIRKAETGNDLILTINFELQEKIFEILQRKVDEVDTFKACVIALNPKTGGVLAMVNIPSFDSNVFSGSMRESEFESLTADKNNPLFNRSISGTYPPGSIVKPMVALFALEDGIINDKTIIQDNGLIQIVNQYDLSVVYNFYGWKRDGLGPMDVYSAIAESSDIFFYTIGGGNGKIDGMGINKLSEHFSTFNLGQRTGIDIFGEATGVIPTPEWKDKVKQEQWYLGDTYHVSIGQGDLLVTPLQTAVWTAAIANDGTAIKPHTGLYKVDSNGNKQMVDIEMLFSVNAEKKNIEIIKKAMRQSVVDGSAIALNSLPIEVAGKTGTAEFGGDDLTHAWFVCFAPYDDPEIVLTVLVEGGGGGSSVAVPIAKEILSFWINSF